MTDEQGSRAEDRKAGAGRAVEQTARRLNEHHIARPAEVPEGTASKAPQQDVSEALQQDDDAADSTHHALPV